MRYFRRRGDSSNTIVGIVIIVVLLVFVGPNLFPSLIARTLPFVDESIPCNRLRNAQGRAYHQSLIGVSSNDPILLRVQPDPIPPTNEGAWIVRIIIQNTTIGTVPIVYEENGVIIGDQTNSSGFGLIFTPPVSLNTGGQRNTANVTSFPEQSIRLLGPRQRCIHRVVFSAAQIDNILRSGQGTVRAYYRITSAGVTQQTNPQATPIFNSQGLDIITSGFIQSDPVQIPITVTAN